MYRKIELRIFLILSILATLFALTAFLLVLGYQCAFLAPFYRHLSFLFLCFSGLCQIHIYMQKVEILEKRVNELRPTHQLDKKTAKLTSVNLMLYMIFFWLALSALGVSLLVWKS